MTARLRIAVIDKQTNKQTNTEEWRYMCRLRRKNTINCVERPQRVLGKAADTVRTKSQRPALFNLLWLHSSGLPSLYFRLYSEIVLFPSSQNILLVRTVWTLLHFSEYRIVVLCLSRKMSWQYVKEAAGVAEEYILYHLFLCP